MKLLSASPSVKNWPLSLLLSAFLVLTAAAGLALQVFGINAAALVAAAGVALTVVPAMRAANTEYSVTNARITARSGVLAKTEESILLSEVRELRLRRSPLQRAMGLGDLEVAGDNRSILLVGLEDPEQARDRIHSLSGQ